MSSTRQYLSRITLLLSVLMLSACGGGGGGDEEASTGTYEIKAIASDVKNVDGLDALRQGEVFQLGIFDKSTGVQDFGVYVDSANQSFELVQYKWTITPSENANLNTESGFKNQLNAVNPGVVTLTAINSKNSLSKQVRILNALLKTVEVSGTQASLYQGLSTQLSIAGSYSNGAILPITEGVVWQSQHPDIATIDANGLVKAVKVGTAIINGSKNDEFGTAITNTFELTVTKAAITTLQIPTSAEIILGRIDNISVMATYTDQTQSDVTANVTWEYTPVNMMNIDNTGKLTTLAQGEVVAKASIDDGYGLSIISGEYALFISDRVIDTVIIAPHDETIDAQSPVIAIERAEQFTLEAVYSTGAKESVIGNSSLSVVSSNVDVASVELNDENQYIITMLSVGETTLKMSVVNRLGTEITSELPLRVNRPPLVSLDISSTLLQIPAGLSVDWQAIGTMEDGTTKDFSSLVTWQNDDLSVASFSTAGTPQKLTTKITGSSNVSASFVNDVGVTIVSNLVAVTVIPAQVQYVQVESVTDGIFTDNKFSIAQGISHNLQLVGIYSDGTREVATSVNWSSSDLSMATVDESNGLLVAGKAAGKTGDLTVSGQTVFEEKDFSGDLALTVTPALLTNLNLSVIAADGLWKGFLVKVVASGTFSDDLIRDISDEVTWSIADGSASYIEQLTTLVNGFKLLDVGTPKVKAQFTDIYNKNKVTLSDIDITISAALLTSISIKAVDDFGLTINDIASGKDVRFIATAGYSDESNNDVSQSVQWNSSPAAFLNFDNTAGKEGYATTLQQTQFDTNLQVSALLINADNKTIATQIPFTILPAALESLTLLPLNNDFCSALSSLDPPSCSEVPSGKTLQLALYGNYSDGNRLAITEDNFATWSIIDDVPTATIDPNTGLVTMTAGTIDQVVTVGAQVPLTDIKGNISLTRKTPIFESIRISPATDTNSPWLLNAGEQVNFKAYAVYSDATEKDITTTAAWAVPAESQAFVMVDDSPSFKGTVTAVDETTENATFTATQVNRLSTVVSTTSYVAIGEPRLEFIEISPLRPQIIAGDSITYTATGFKTNNASLDLTHLVTWESQRQNIASFDVTNKNIVTGVAEGTSYITASYVPPGEADAIIASTQMQVTAKTLRSISIVPTTARTDIGSGKHLFMKGLNDQLSAVGLYSDGSTDNISNTVNWVSNASAVATVTGGLFVSATKGDVTISADIDIIESGVTKNIAIDYVAIVGDPLLQLIEVSPQSTVLLANDGVQQYSALGYYSDGTNGDLTSTVTWLAGNASDLSADKVGEFITPATKGLLTAQKIGTIGVSATIKDFDNVDKVGNTLVNVVGIASIIVEQIPAGAIYAGQNATFRAQGITADNKRVDLNHDITWGIVGAGVINPASDGTGTVTVDTSSNAGFTLTATVVTSGLNDDLAVTVNTKLLTSMTLSVDSLNVPHGLTRQASINATYSDGSNGDATTSVSWVSADVGKLTVDAAGVISTTGAGTVNLKAQFTNATGDLIETNAVDMVISAPALTSLTLGSAISLPLGLGNTFIANGVNSDGSGAPQIDANQLIWTSTDEAVAVVNSDGVITTLSTGTTTITAKKLAVYNDVNGDPVDVLNTAVVTVDPAVLASINATAPASIPVGRTLTLTVQGQNTDGTIDNAVAVSWSIDANLTVNNSATGDVTAATAGTANITVTAVANDHFGNPIVDTLAALVTPPVLKTLNLALPASIPLGFEKDYISVVTGIGTDNNAITPTGLTWSSSTANVQIVGSSSLKGNQQGTSTITVTSSVLDENGDPVKNQSNVLVTAAILESFTAVLSSTAPANKIIPLGRTITPDLIGVGTDGSSIFPNGVTWTSDNPAAVEITVGNKFLAKAAGTGIKLTATSTDHEFDTVNDITFELTGIDVGAEVLDSMTINNITEIPLGASTTLTVDGLGSNSTAAFATGIVTWQSNSPAIEVVNAATGEVKAKIVGQSAVITATSDQKDALGNNIIATRTIQATAEELASFTAVIFSGDPGNKTIPLGRTVTPELTGVGTNGSNISPNNVTWVSNAPAAIEITDGTKFYAKTDVDGTTLTATSTDIKFGTVSDKITFALTGADVGLEVLDSMTINNLTSMPLGATTTLSLNGVGSNATGGFATGSVTWTSSSTAIEVTNSATGDIKAKIAGQSAVITATSDQKDVNGNDIVATQSISVSIEQLASVNITAPATVPLGLSSSFNVSGVGSNGSTMPLSGIVWSSNNVALAITDTANGGYNAVSAQTGITLTVATSDTNYLGAAIGGSVSIDVVAAAPANLVVTSPAQIPLGRTVTGLSVISVAAFDTNGGTISVGNVNWTDAPSAELTIANANTATPTLTAAQIGTTQLTVTSDVVDHNSQALTETVSVEVIGEVLDSMTITAPPVGNNIALGRTYTLSVTGLGTNNGAIVPDGVVWSTSNSSNIEIVNASTGEIKGVNNGLSATITATSTNKDAAGAFITVTISLAVVNAVLETIAISSNDVVLPVGTTETFTATGTDSNNQVMGSITGLAWTSDDESVAIVDISTGVVTAIGVGTANITAKSTDEDVNGVDIEQTKPVTVVAAVAVAIELHVLDGLEFVEQEKLVIISVDIMSDDSTQTSTRSLDWTKDQSEVKFLDGAAPVDTLTATGAITVTSQVLSGSQTVVFSAIDNSVSPALSATLSIRVKDGVIITKIDTDRATLQVADNNKQPLKVAAVYDDHSVRDVSISIDNSWSNGGSTFVSVSGGVATFTNAASTETATLTSTYQAQTVAVALSIENSDLNDGVTAGILQSLEVYPRTANIAQYTSIDFKVYATYKVNGSDEFIVQDVSADALITGLDASTVSVQTVNASYGGVTINNIATVNVRKEVKRIEIATIIDTFSNNPLGRSLNYPVLATAILNDGAGGEESQDVTDLVLWSTTNTHASINNLSGSKGLMTPAATFGGETITATLFTANGLVTGTKGITIANSTVRTLNSVAITLADASTPTNFGKDVDVAFKATATYSSAPTSVDITEIATWYYAGTDNISNVNGSRGLLTRDVTTSTSASVSVNIAGTSVTSTYAITGDDEAVNGLDTITKTGAITNVGNVAQLSVDATFATSPALDVTDHVVWVSDEPGIVFVSNAPATKGQVVRITSGTANIKAYYKGQVSATLTLN